jgi:hypothetical protein
MEIKRLRGLAVFSMSSDIELGSPFWSPEQSLVPRNTWIRGRKSLSVVSIDAYADMSKTTGTIQVVRNS